MPTLTLTPSLSHSTIAKLAECPTRYRLRTFTAWEGWRKSAPPEARQAYRLKQMKSLPALIGLAVEDACRWLVGEAKGGALHPPSLAVERALAALRRQWKEHESEGWRDDPKSCTAVMERYYGDACKVTEVRAKVERCIGDFHQRLLARLVDAPLLDIEPFGGFAWQGLRIFAAPDFAWRDDEGFHILDLKTGRPRPEHSAQLDLYSRQAFEADATLEAVRCELAYLDAGESSHELVLRRDRCGEPVAEGFLRRGRETLARYLVDGDVERFEPLPAAEWPMAPVSACRWCAFREVCDR